eukprot:GHVT01005608.1.p2 GENE.GHVT01005608.1~~GHVT01005608.1.p2  ORF type:complete len:169 (-),score=44.49 GHVT01005608.1:279-785(-)
MYLLHLLSCNRIGDFHMALELIPAEDRARSPYLLHPIALEQHLTDGDVGKAVAASALLEKLGMFSFFLDRLNQTIQETNAAAIEAAYNVLDVEYARKMLFLNSAKHLEEFAAKQNARKDAEPGGRVIRWVVEGRNLHLRPTEDTKSKLPAIEIIQNTIGYATELERIV